ncbi:hypothetical protein MJO28_016895 [Puccinia striiformis f. sp. tritici]|nr:hypothetical protein MJO28_016895 [Puccinia striiformis f. sp. tritici]
MSSLINFKAIQGIIVVGPLAELNNKQIIQCFTPDVVQLMIDHLPENFCPSEGCPKLVVENDPETCHALYIKDNGLSLTQGEHDAFIKKLVSFFGCEMPLPDGLVISARVRLVFTCGDRAWINRQRFYHSTSEPISIEINSNCLQPPFSRSKLLNPNFPLVRYCCKAIMLDSIVYPSNRLPHPLTECVCQML